MQKSINELYYNNIYNNRKYCVGTYDSDCRINAINNWWGEASGPTHINLNKEGMGDNISDNVEFKPWLDEPVIFSNNIDSDFDTYLNNLDAFPYNSTEWLDTDSDGIGDNSDPDDDNDGYLDQWEEFFGLDPKDTNERPQDTDLDGMPDGDLENTEPWMDIDDDSDGYLDTWELFLNTDSKNREDKPLDHDKDGAPDGVENNSQYWMDKDDDNDSYSDDDERLNGTDPLDENDHPVENNTDKRKTNEDYTIFILMAIIIISFLIILGIFVNLKKKNEK